MTIKSEVLDAMTTAEDRWNETTQHMVRLAMAYVLRSQGIDGGTVHYNADKLRDMLVTHRVLSDFNVETGLFSVTLEPRNTSQESLPL